MSTETTRDDARHTEIVQSWGRAQSACCYIDRPWFLGDIDSRRTPDGASFLTRGLGRSYGDVALNSNGRLIDATRLDRFIAADWRTGVIRAEAGLSFDNLLRVCAPKGWFPPVCPGTKFVTLGGAVANDAHGKNHEAAGTIGRHVRLIGLMRSDGAILELSPNSHPDLFAATIGGLGLTGVILWSELQLEPIRSCYFETERIAFHRLDRFFELARDSADWPYTAAWVDATARGESLGRGVLFRGRRADDGRLQSHAPPHFHTPITAPLINALTLRAFNAYYRARPRGRGVRRAHYDSFLFPLDALANWNRLYGARGFYQHQSVMPIGVAADAVGEVLRVTAASGETPALTVLKLFGDATSPGLLSFPMQGATLALDFPNRGARTIKLLDALAKIVDTAGGRLYPAKDATMAPEIFRAGFPQWRKLEALRDPAIMSDFWARVTRGAI